MWLKEVKFKSLNKKLLKKKVSVTARGEATSQKIELLIILI